MVTIEIIKGDITKIKADAIVNAANSSLMGGGGVDGAIHRAGGPKILEECKAIVAVQGGCKVGEAVATTAGQLQAQYVIHTVGPQFKSGNREQAEKLANCYKNSIKLADQKCLKTIAFPNISTGIYGYPKDEAANIALKTVKSADPEHLQKVIFVCFDDENFKLYEKGIQ